MSNPLYGQIPEFYGDGDDWNVYYERLEQFFSVNDIPQDKQSAFLISVIGSYTYKTLRDLCHPALPKEKTFAELCDLLRRQFAPQVSVFRERAKFYSASQEPHENISAWYIKVKKLSVDCRFGPNLEMVLLDKFITGLRSGPILDRLCEEKETITLKDALDIAVNKESALAVELPPNPIIRNCYECCVPPPLDTHEEENVEENHQDDENDNNDHSSVAGDSGFKEPQLAICPPAPNDFFQRPLGGAAAQEPLRLCQKPARKMSKATLGKPIGSPMAEMPSPEICFDGVPPPPMAMAAPPVAMAMAAPRPVMRKAMMERPLTLADDNENVIMEPMHDDDAMDENNKKKKTRRGCRGGRKNKKRTENELK